VYISKNGHPKNLSVNGHHVSGSLVDFVTVVGCVHRYIHIHLHIHIHIRLLICRQTRLLQSAEKI